MDTSGTRNLEAYCDFCGARHYILYRPWRCQWCGMLNQQRPNHGIQGTAETSMLQSITTESETGYQPDYREEPETMWEINSCYQGGDLSEALEEAAKAVRSIGEENVLHVLARRDDDVPGAWWVDVIYQGRYYAGRD